MSINIELITPGNRAQWNAYHDIRRRILFEARGQHGVYDDRHPDEFDPGNHPKILVHDGLVVGVVRIDLAERYGILRRVAIDEPFREMGFGRKLIELSERFIVSHGKAEVITNAARESVGFYGNCGFETVGDEPKDEAGSVLMRKSLKQK